MVGGWGGYVVGEIKNKAKLSPVGAGTWAELGNFFSKILVTSEGLHDKQAQIKDDLTQRSKNIILEFSRFKYVPTRVQLCEQWHKITIV